MPVDLVQIFDSSVPRSFQKACLHNIKDAYTEAYKEILLRLDLEKEESRDFLPYLRRTLIERNMRNLAGQYSGVSVKCRKNAAKNCHHNVIHSGKIMMTISSLDSPYRKLRDAIFRSQYVQGTLFDEDEILLCIDDTYYGIVCHGEDSFARGSLGFVHILFPKYNYTIDLAARFPDIFTRETEMENIPDDLSITVRELRKRKEA